MGVVIDVHVPVSGRARNAIICKFAQINSMQSTESSAEPKIFAPPATSQASGKCMQSPRTRQHEMGMKHSVQDGAAAEERGTGASTPRVGAEHCRFLRPHCRSLVNDMQNITLHPQQPKQQQRPQIRGSQQQPVEPPQHSHSWSPEPGQR